LVGALFSCTRRCVGLYTSDWPQPAAAATTWTEENACRPVTSVGRDIALRCPRTAQRADPTFDYVRDNGGSWYATVGAIGSGHHCAEPGVTEMNLSYVQKLLMAVDPFSSTRANFRSWREKALRNRLEDKKLKRLRRRHLTCRQREDISTDLEDSVTGPVSMTASASDTEAVCYEDEIANVLEETGFKVEIDNAARKPAEEQIPTGVELTVKDETIRPVHALRILRAFRRAGVAIATRINAMRQSNNTLYITVGSNAAPAAVPPLTRATAEWQSQVLRTLRAKWKTKLASGLRRRKQGD